MTDLLILQGHPNRASFVSALAAAYATGARSRGASVRSIELADLAFDPVLHHGHHAEQALEPSLREVLEAIVGASHVTFAFPTWWAGPPALVKGLIDRLFVPGVAFRWKQGSALPEGLFAGRSARMITTMDSPRSWYWWKHGRAVHRAFVDATLDFCGFGPVTTSTVHGVRTLDERARHAALTRLEREGAADARRAAAGTAPGVGRSPSE